MEVFMRPRIAFALLATVTFAVLGSAPSLQAQDKVFTNFSTAQIEQILTDLNLEFKKTASKTDGIFFYDYKRDKNSIRLHYFKGKDLMLDVLLKDNSLDTLNRWNRRAKFSRASLHKDDKGAYTALESNLDLVGGVTARNVAHFIRTFHDEIPEFERFLGGSEPVPPVVAGGSDKIMISVSSDKLEGILKDLKITYKKQTSKDMVSQFYDYQSKGFKMRLYNFGGKDLMVDAIFKKLPLESVNKYNFERKFIRTVLYMPQGGMEYTALEANLDCRPGISENMVRHFLVTFEEEVQAFLTFVNKMN
jgi:Putative bacterial sensory transduction regulator